MGDFADEAGTSEVEDEDAVLVDVDVGAFSPLSSAYFSASP